MLFHDGGGSAVRKSGVHGEVDMLAIVHSALARKRRIHHPAVGEDELRRAAALKLGQRGDGVAVDAQHQRIALHSGVLILIVLEYAALHERLAEVGMRIDRGVYDPAAHLHFLYFIRYVRARVRVTERRLEIELLSALEFLRLHLLTVHHLVVDEGVRRADLVRISRGINGAHVVGVCIHKHAVFGDAAQIARSVHRDEIRHVISRAVFAEIKRKREVFVTVVGEFHRRETVEFPACECRADFAAVRGINAGRVIIILRKIIDGAVFSDVQPERRAQIPSRGIPIPVRTLGRSRGRGDISVRIRKGRSVGFLEVDAQRHAARPRVGRAGVGISVTFIGGTRHIGVVVHPDVPLRAALFAVDARINHRERGFSSLILEGHLDAREVARARRRILVVRTLPRSACVVETARVPDAGDLAVRGDVEVVVVAVRAEDPHPIARERRREVERRRERSARPHGLRRVRDDAVRARVAVRDDAAQDVILKGEIVHRDGIAVHLCVVRDGGIYLPREVHGEECEAVVPRSRLVHASRGVGVHSVKCAFLEIEIESARIPLLEEYEGMQRGRIGAVKDTARGDRAFGIVHRIEPQQRDFLLHTRESEARGLFHPPFRRIYRIAFGKIGVDDIGRGGLHDDASHRHSHRRTASARVRNDKDELLLRVSAERESQRPLRPRVARRECYCAAASRVEELRRHRAAV